MNNYGKHPHCYCSECAKVYFRTAIVNHLLLCLRPCFICEVNTTKRRLERPRKIWTGVIRQDEQETGPPWQQAHQLCADREDWWPNGSLTWAEPRTKFVPITHPCNISSSAALFSTTAGSAEFTAQP